MRAGGRVINCLGCSAASACLGYTASCASKHAILGFTRALALDCAAANTGNAFVPAGSTEMANQGMKAGAAATGTTFGTDPAGVGAGAGAHQAISNPKSRAALVALLASPAAAASRAAVHICVGQPMD